MFSSRLIAGVLLALATTCCSPSKSDLVENQERAALAPLKATYPDVIMGYDFHGRSVDVSVNLNALVSMDKPDTMKAQALRDWKAAWLAAHPGNHGLLTVRIIDFRGSQESKETTRV